MIYLRLAAVEIATAARICTGGSRMYYYCPQGHGVLAYDRRCSHVGHTQNCDLVTATARVERLCHVVGLSKRTGR